MDQSPSPAPKSASRSFAAFTYPAYRAQFACYVLAMMADNVEHVISYWMVFQKFHSPALAGFAVLSHWLPFLLFSVAVGGLADRVDPRRIIQWGMGLFMLASAGWGFFFVTDTLSMWGAMVLLVIHGCAGVLWQTPNQMLIYDIVSQAHLPSAVRLNATARYLGVLVGPAVGGVIMLTLGPSKGIIVNTFFYLPMVLWLFWAPARQAGAAARRLAVRGLADIIETIRAIAGYPVLTSMTLLAGLTSFMVGNAYNAQMPGFATDLGHGDPGVSYSLLLAADAAGALLAGFALEAWSRFKPTPRLAILLSALWCSSLLAFACVRYYPAALILLFAAGFFELSFNTMAQALVQLDAPVDLRGRVLGLYNMAGLGMRAFSGITVGLLGSAIGIHWSLGVSAAVLLVMLLFLHRLAMKRS
ncbi:MFS transporter [Rhodoplanes sp. Z2-YC6860]|uniref:MFS transporter n=1 Tax=Rhodoplanes sp. Z2-YC6860 TaxID=674703 RepID=UPI00078B905E|nr:MFS transporter [Rhodoplanes sp. Z2-YC6860]AMN43921.1 major facilitator superfamily protein [Rhodoplanes sp. Z2-YC6860]